MTKARAIPARLDALEERVESLQFSIAAVERRQSRPIEFSQGERPHDAAGERPELVGLTERASTEPNPNPQQQPAREGNQTPTSPLAAKIENDSPSGIARAVVPTGTTARSPSPRPLCGICTRNARTVDTPRVHARVESCTVFRYGEKYQLIARCHGAEETVILEHPTSTSEDAIERLICFRQEP